MTPFTSFLVKIASRCNIACDYCYMYEHTDQSWRYQPHVMSSQTMRLLASRLAEYVEHVDLKEIYVLLHGGEPLLAGTSTIIELVSAVRSNVRPQTAVYFSMQTNGTLLDRAALGELAANDVMISLSLDGPKAANDLHRISKRGGSTFAETMRALELLAERPESFAGIISVIDPDVPAADLLAFFEAWRPPKIDFLLPDANHLRPPPKRERDPDLYSVWLIEAFDEWFDRYPQLPVRLFDEILRSVAGLASGTDAFGIGDISLLSIETDGGYHDLDVLKITAEDATSTGLSLDNDPILLAADSERIRRHRRLVSREGLSAQCRACPELRTCGGGSVPHRFDADGFDHPTIYCREMLALIGHARQRLTRQLSLEARRVRESRTEASLTRPYDLAEQSAPYTRELLSAWRREAAQELARLPGTQDVLDGLADSWAVTHPSVTIRARVLRDSLRGVATRSLDGEVLQPPDDLPRVLSMLSGSRPGRWTVHRDDRWLRAPFGHPIVFERDPDAIDQGRALLVAAEDLIKEYSGPLFDEMMALSHEIQFVRDTEAHPDKAVSFSDDSVPGALYVSIPRGNGDVRAYDLADSLIHEHRHQKLYILQRAHRLVEEDLPLVRSPWREDPRPPSGLLHAVFVFVELRRFWRFAAESAGGEVATRAQTEIETTDERLARAREILAGVSLTDAGASLTAELFSSLASP